MRKAVFYLVLGGALLSGCTSTRRSPEYQTGVREHISVRDEGDECGASLVQSFVGLRANDTTREEVARRSGARDVRWIEPNSAVTLDYRPDRINGELDQDGVITTLRCG
ncbi:MAG: hypothetical protein IT553_05400 [Sphingomonadaceae bacterium]|nr:hypothetical protein [Sphingomonadaceae bacterium]